MASKPKKQDPTYFKALAASAPVFGAKAIIGDLPKGALEKAVQLKIERNTPMKRGLKQGVKGRGFGRAVGGLTGVLTAPLYLKGLSLLSSKKRSDKKKGMALISGVTGAYQLQKGVNEGFFEHARKGRGAAVKRGLGLGLGRLSYKVPAALLMAKAVADGQKKGKGNKGLANVALLGALSGAGSRVGDVASEKVFGKITSGKKINFNKALGRKVLGAAGGGAAGGLLGGLILSKAVSMAKDSLK
jgi:hypothetical protein